MERHMMKRLILLAAGALSCAAYGEEVSAINATANLDKQFQTIESFTASDAWSGNFIGKFFADDKKYITINNFAPITIIQKVLFEIWITISIDFSEIYLSNFLYIHKFFSLMH